jgi:hypothetical protein
MGRYTVEKGGKYRASFKLSGLEGLASNDMIKGKLEAAGFSRVKVWGSGGVRYASAEWHKENATAEMPSQVHQIVKDN